MEALVETPPGASGKPRRTLPAALFAVAAAAVALFLLLGRNAEPTDASAEAGFARDMGMHHAQAVEMAFFVRDAGAEDDVRTLAGDIIVTQTAQRGMFMGWLQQWELNQSGELPRMAWMSGHGHGGAAAPAGGMPGMATEDELRRLEEAEGEDAEVLFLQLMIRHHEGGVRMAQALLGLSDRTEVVTLARHIVNGQTAEIKVMADMLAKRGARPLGT
ncbi:DUF305 domain-containing protein [Microtetraspora sp. NBRC 13810]|uniref:DUF305 domain-containing protein n=1 Tax=Microtetraspora sp. NBRC 13810 TaxID=3030990 RepID=UPI0024A5F8E4|nr:DUF305 domain-containing protein [Microtetraspora sp. NBRC 13810]GLW07191.1 DUF305 domain-containing protein [Microtetraspora sp. NBRC 13810]